MRKALCGFAAMNLLAACGAHAAEVVLENARIRAVLGEDAVWRSLLDKHTGKE